MEEWDIYTENREKTGRVHIRGEKNERGGVSSCGDCSDF